MAKFAQVGYGHDGRGIGQTEGGYTYIVNDNVRTGDLIVPIPAFNVKAGRDVLTTSKVLSTTVSLNRNTVRASGVSNEDIRNELVDKGLADEDEYGMVDAYGLKDISDDKGVIVRNYGNQELFENQLKKGQDKATAYNKEQKDLAQLESDNRSKYTTYDSYTGIKR